MMPNILQYPVALFGTLRAGYTVVNCNPLYTPRELEHQLNDSGAEAIVILENFASTLAQVIANTSVKHVVVTRLGDLFAFPQRTLVNFVVRYIKRMVPAWHIPGVVSFRSALRQGAARELQPVDVGPDDIAFLQYTGGTTGVPKGAMLSHANMVANLQQAHAWLKSFLEEGRETIITPLPLYHIFALTANCLVFLKIGATNVLITNPRDIPALVNELASHRFTVITGVNTLYNALLNNPNFAKLDFSPLKLCLGGGSAIHKSVAEKWKQVTGRALIEAYGLTETSPAVAVNPLNLAEYSGSIGLPLPSTEIAIRDDDGNDLSVGEVGELCVRGPQVMKGYRRRPDETAEVMMADGFLRTGDIAMVDELGYVRIIDRKKDLISVSGFKVFPHELEEVVDLHPGRPRVRGGRRPGRAVGGGREARGRAQGPCPYQRRGARVLPEEFDRLQGAPAHRVSRDPAEDANRQDPAEGIARSGCFDARQSHRREETIADTRAAECMNYEFPGRDDYSIILIRYFARERFSAADRLPRQLLPTVRAD